MRKNAVKWLDLCLSDEELGKKNYSTKSHVFPRIFNMHFPSLSPPVQSPLSPGRNYFFIQRNILHAFTLICFNLLMSIRSPVITYFQWVQLSNKHKANVLYEPPKIHFTVWKNFIGTSRLNSLLFTSLNFLWFTFTFFFACQARDHRALWWKWFFSFYLYWWNEEKYHRYLRLPLPPMSSFLSLLLPPTNSIVNSTLSKIN